MDETRRKLIQILLTKNFSKDVNQLVLGSFNIICTNFPNDLDLANWFISAISSVKEIEIKEINDDKIFKDDISKINQKTIIINRYNKTFYKFVNNKYIIDKNGTYYGKCKGYILKKQHKIVILKNESYMHLRLFHELIHESQIGYKSSYKINKVIYFLLTEGEAEEISKRIFCHNQENSVLKQDKLTELEDNGFSYFMEYHLFQGLKLILGNDFISKWKHDVSDTDYFMEMINFFDKYGKKYAIEEVIANYFLLKEYDEIKSRNSKFKETINEYFSLTSSAKTPGEIVNDEIVTIILNRYDEAIKSDNIPTYQSSLMAEIELLFNDCINNMVDFTPNKQHQYKSYILSSFKLKRKTMIDNSDYVYNSIMDRLDNSRNETLTKIDNQIISEQIVQILNYQNGNYHYQTKSSKR